MYKNVTFESEIKKSTTINYKELIRLRYKQFFNSLLIINNDKLSLSNERKIELDKTVRVGLMIAFDGEEKLLQVKYNIAPNKTTAIEKLRDTIILP